MAKGNLILGMARGSVGDVVMSRQRGEQVARVRARVVSQPNTMAQKVEKAAMATVSQAYKAMKKVVNKTFEGYKTGSETQAEFTSRNINMVRAGLLGGVTRVVEYKASNMVANPYIISDGTLPVLFTMDGGLRAGYSSGETVAEWCSRNDIKRSDVFAICLINAAPYYSDENVLASFGDAPEAKHMKTRFGYYQFKISATAIKSDALCSEVNFADIWDVSHQDVRTLMSGGWDASSFDFDAVEMAWNGSQRVLMCGVVRMRSTGRLRSRGAMVSVDNDAPMCGITYDYLELAWSNATSEITSDGTVLGGSGFHDDTGGSSTKPKKLNQLLAKYWVENAQFYYVLMGGYRGVANPVIRATYTDTVEGKLQFELQACTSGNNILTSDEYGNVTLVPVSNVTETAYAIAGDAAYIASNSQDSTHYDGWHTQYKKSAAYNQEDGSVGLSIVVNYRSYDKS